MSVCPPGTDSMWFILIQLFWQVEGNAEVQIYEYPSNQKNDKVQEPSIFTWPECEAVAISRWQKQAEIVILKENY